MPSALQSKSDAALLAEYQESFDFLLPRKPMLRADEIARATSLDERTVIRLMEKGALHGHEFNAAGDARKHRRYRRDSVILMLAKTATYTPEDLINAYVDALTSLSLRQLLAIQQHLNALIRRKQS